MKIMKLLRQKQVSRQALVIFSSDPAAEAQRKGLGNSVAETSAIYRALLLHLFDTVVSARKQQKFDLIVVSDASDADNIREAAEFFPEVPAYEFIPHRGNRFADKFSHALKATFARGYRQVIIIGNDCPDITPALLCQAFGQLAHSDVVLGPARDGGFYLLGLTRYDDRLLSDIPWCSSAVCARITCNIKNLGFSLHLLPVKGDIDARRDLHNWLGSAGTAHTIRLRNTLQWMLLVRCFTCFYLPPFIRKTNSRKRVWQKPPPAPHLHI
jgi:hypothetical protein